MLGEEEIRKRFGSTAKAPAATATAHDQLREKFIMLALEVDALMGDVAYHAVDIAVVELEIASMWAQKALAESLRT